MSQPTFSRQQRVADSLQREIAAIIQKEVQDPRLGLVSITAVKLARDYSRAKIFVSVLDDDKASAAVTALNHAAKFIRHELARRVNMRTTPSLEFVYDESIQRGQHLSDLIDQAK